MNKGMKSTVLVTSTFVLGSIVAPAGVQAAGAKTIHWTENADLPSMDNSMATDMVSFNALTATGDGLYRTGKSGKPELALAQSVEKSEDGLKYTFKLRDGLKWSNGDALTAKDFVYSWQRTNNPETGSQYAYLFDGIANATKIQNGEVKDLNELGVKALDDTTLEVTLESPMPQLEAILTMATFYPQNQAFVEKTGKKFGTAAKYTLSSGPYKLTGWTGSNNKYNFEKNDNYYDADKVKTKKITVQTIKDQNTGYNLFKSGKVDYTNLSPDQVKASKKKKAYKVTAQARTAYIALNQKSTDLKETALRQAISYAIDREKLANNILTGTATPAFSFTSVGLAKNPNTGKDFAESAKSGAVKFDKKKATKLWAEGLKAVGKKSLKLQLLTDDTDDAKRAAQFVQSQLEDNLKGMDVTIKTAPYKQRLALSKSGDFQMVMSGWGADFADPITFLDLLTTGSAFNDGEWSNAEYDKLITASKTTDVQDEKKRYDDLTQAEELIQKEAGVVPLYYKSFATLTNTNIKGMIVNTVGAPFDWKYAVKK